MKWRRFNNARGDLWQVNNDGLRLLSHAYCRMLLMQENARVASERLEIGLGLGIPWSNIEYNWSAINAGLPKRVATFYQNNLLLQDFVSDASVEFLAGIRQSTRAGTERMKSSLKKMSEQNSAEFARMDAFLTKTMDITKAVRDGCFTGVVVISGFLTGGAAWTALGGGAFLKGVASYQDTQSFGSATLTAAGTLVVGAIPLGGNAFGIAKTAGQKTLLLVGSSVTDGGFATANAIVDGKTVSNAVTAGLARTGLDLVGGKVDLKLEKFAMLTRVSVSMTSSIGSDYIVPAVAEAVQSQAIEIEPKLPSATQKINFASDGATAMTDRQFVLRNVLRPGA